MQQAPQGGPLQVDQRRPPPTQMDDHHGWNGTHALPLPMHVQHASTHPIAAHPLQHVIVCEACSVVSLITQRLKRYICQHSLQLLNTRQAYGSTPCALLPGARTDRTPLKMFRCSSKLKLIARPNVRPKSAWPTGSGATYPTPQPTSRQTCRSSVLFPFPEGRAGLTITTQKDMNGLRTAQQVITTVAADYVVEF